MAQVSIDGFTDYIGEIAFAKYKVARYKKTEKSRGFAFVSMTESMPVAMNALNHAKIEV